MSGGKHHHGAGGSSTAAVSIAATTSTAGSSASAMVHRMEKQLQDARRDRDQVATSHSNMLAALNILKGELSATIAGYDHKLNPPGRSLTSSSSSTTTAGSSNRAAPDGDSASDVDEDTGEKLTGPSLAKKKFFRFVDDFSKEKKPDGAAPTHIGSSSGSVGAGGSGKKRDYKTEWEKLKVQVILRDTDGAIISGLQAQTASLEDQRRGFQEEISFLHTLLRAVKHENSSLRSLLVAAKTAPSVESTTESTDASTTAAGQHQQQSSSTARREDSHDHPFDDIFGDEASGAGAGGTGGGPSSSSTPPPGQVQPSPPSAVDSSSSGGGDTAAALVAVDEKVHRHLTALQVELDQLRMQSRELLRLKGEEKQHIESLSAAMLAQQQLQQGTCTLEEENASLKSQVTRLVEMLGEINAAKDADCQEEAAAEAAQATSNDVDSSALEAELEVLGMQHQQLEGERQRAVSEMEELRTRNELLLQQLSSLRDSYAQLEVEVDGLKLTSSSAETHSRARMELEGRITEIRQQQELSDEGRATLNRLLHTASTETAIAQRALRSLSVRYWDNAGKLTDAQSRELQTQSDLLFYDGELEAKSGRIAQLESELREEKERVVDLQARLEDTHVQSQLEMAKVRRHMKELKTALASLQSELPPGASPELSKFSGGGGGGISPPTPSFPCLSPASPPMGMMTPLTPGRVEEGDSVCSRHDQRGDDRPAAFALDRQHHVDPSSSSPAAVREGGQEQQVKEKAVVKEGSSSAEVINRLRRRVVALEEDNERKGQLILDFITAEARLREGTRGGGGVVGQSPVASSSLATDGSTTAFASLRTAVNRGELDASGSTGKWNPISRLLRKGGSANHTTATTTNHHQHARKTTGGLPLPSPVQHATTSTDIRALQHLLEEKLSENLQLQQEVERLQQHQVEHQHT